MKKTLLHYLKITLFYVIFFSLWRLIFLIVNIPEDGSVHWKDTLPSFFYGLRMDISMSCYLLVPTLLLNLIFYVYPKKIINQIDFFIHAFVIIVISHVVAGNAVLYHFWNSMINFRAVSYLVDPTEVFTSLTLIQSIVVIIGMIILLSGSILLFRKFAYQPFKKTDSNAIIKFGSLVISAGLIVIGIRGGVQMLPMNESLVYYSKNNFLNQSAVNPVWHLTYDIYTAGLSTSNPFQKIPDDKADPIVDKLLQVSYETFPQVLTNQRPNIVMIILESFTADVVASLGGDKRTDPNLEKMISEGIFFDSIYSSGTRTDQGIVSVLNGWPATPYHSIMRSSEKSMRLPSLVKTLALQNYTTSFYYGGEGNFSNLDAYCVTQKFNKIISNDNFDPKLGQSRWGVADEFLFDKHFLEISKSKEPFFTTLMTLSNHEPFDVPGEVRITGESEANKFRNSAAYTDACLGDYLKKAATMPWYANTLFVIVADHGHRLPMQRLILDPESRRIPLLFFGEVIKPEYRGMKIHKAGGHHDIPSTILYQMALNASAYQWSKNLLNPLTPSYAFYQFEETFGYIEDTKWAVYSYNTETVINHSHPLTTPEMDSLLIKGQSYMQRLYAQYQKY